jgi:predicted nucleic acid-binding Zn ribbon protein
VFWRNESWKEEKKCNERIKQERNKEKHFMIRWYEKR